MNVTELFRRLSYGELSNLSIGENAIGTIRESDQSKLIHYTNEALLRLHSRFSLIEKSLILVTSEYETSYKLSSKYAVTSNDPTTPCYIYDDAEQPFTDDVIRILGVSNVSGGMLPLNDAGSIYSVFTPQPDVIQIPAPVKGESFGVMYQARHPILAYDNLESEIELPVVLEGALTAYIGHLVFFHMNGQDNASKAIQFLATYDGICREVEAKDLINFSGIATPSKFEDRGFT